MSTPRRRSGASGIVLASLSVLAPVLVLVGCSGDDASAGGGSSPEEVLATAKATLDETSGVHLTLTTDDLPDGVTGIKSADGLGTHDPAFDGEITVVLSGQDFDVPVIAVDGTVYVQLPLAPGWQDIDPGDYGAPDPAQLLSPDRGFSALLPATTDLAAGESVRGGEDNKEILTEYTGTVPDSAVQHVIPTASGDFDAAYTVSEDGELRQAVLTGVFYEDAPAMTYTVGFDDYGTETEITAP